MKSSKIHTQIATYFAFVAALLYSACATDVAGTDEQTNNVADNPTSIDTCSTVVPRDTSEVSSSSSSIDQPYSSSSSTIIPIITEQFNVIIVNRDTIYVSSTHKGYIIIDTVSTGAPVIIQPSETPFDSSAADDPGSKGTVDDEPTITDPIIDVPDTNISVSTGVIDSLLCIIMKTDTLGTEIVGVPEENPISIQFYTSQGALSYKSDNNTQSIHCDRYNGERLYYDVAYYGGKIADREFTSNDSTDIREFASQCKSTQQLYKTVISTGDIPSYTTTQCEEEIIYASVLENGDLDHNVNLSYVDSAWPEYAEKIINFCTTGPIQAIAY